MLFSDEVEQSYLRYTDPVRARQSPVTKDVVEDALRAGIRIKFYAFSPEGFAGRPGFWEDATLAGNGAHFRLTSSAVSMYNDLMSIIDEACLPRDAENEDEAARLFRRDTYYQYGYASYEFGMCM